MHDVVSRLSVVTSTARTRGNGIAFTIARLLIVSVVAVVAIDLLTDPALAQSTATVNTPPDPSASKSGFENMLGNLYTIASLVLKYVGFVALVLGPAIYFISGSNSDRSRRGLQMSMGGAMMSALQYGGQAFGSVLRGVAGG
jgi:hypothetical protein